MIKVARIVFVVLLTTSWLISANRGEPIGDNEDEDDLVCEPAETRRN